MWCVACAEQSCIEQHVVNRCACRATAETVMSYAGDTYFSKSHNSRAVRKSARGTQAMRVQQGDLSACAYDWCCCARGNPVRKFCRSPIATCHACDSTSPFHTGCYHSSQTSTTRHVCEATYPNSLLLVAACCTLSSKQTSNKLNFACMMP